MALVALKRRAGCDDSKLALINAYSTLSLRYF